MMGNDNYESLEQIENNNIEIQVGIGDRCVINKCIIDKNVRIGDDSKISGGSHLEDIETDLYQVKDGIIIIKKGAILPKGTVI